MKLTLYTDGRCVYSFFQWIPELLTLQRYSRSRAVPEWQASMMACRRTPWRQRVYQQPVQLIIHNHASLHSHPASGQHQCLEHATSMQPHVGWQRFDQEACTSLQSLQSCQSCTQVLLIFVSSLKRAVSAEQPGTHCLCSQRACTRLVSNQPCGPRCHLPMTGFFSGRCIPQSVEDGRVLVLPMLHMYTATMAVGPSKMRA